MSIFLFGFFGWGAHDIVARLATYGAAYGSSLYEASRHTECVQEPNHGKNDRLFENNSRGVAETLGWQEAEVQERLAHVSDLERDLMGRIVGWGLTLLPTPHRLQLQRKMLYTWCALDTLMYPVCLDLSARGEAYCPITQPPIRFLVSPQQISDVQPTQTMMSLVLPAVREDCSREHFCAQSHFFASGMAASVWKQAHPDEFLLVMEEAALLGRLVATARKQRLQQPDKPSPSAH